LRTEDFNERLACIRQHTSAYVSARLENSRERLT
jgi:hypothetical protein